MKNREIFCRGHCGRFYLIQKKIGSKVRGKEADETIRGVTTSREMVEAAEVEESEG